MCIVCRVGVELADEFRGAFYRARKEMERARDAMAKAAEVDPDYDRTHKRIVKLLREWNRIEHTREQRRDDHQPT